MTAWQTTTKRNRLATVVALMVALFVFVGATTAFAQTNYSTATPAGTQIQNSASVSYQDQSNNNYSAQSASVSTYVQQIDGYVLSPATYALNGVANENVAIKYVITNYSNGSEKIQLNISNISNVDIVSSSAHLYQDSSNAPNAAAGDINGTSVTLAQNGTYTFWFVGTMLSAADAKNGNNFTVVGTDQGAPSVPAGVGANWTAPTLYTGAGTTSTVTVNLTSGAVINMSKALSPASGTGGTLNTTLTYSNPGARAATSVWVVDYLPATTFTYTPGANVIWQGQTVTPGTGALSSAVTVGGQTFQAAYYNGVANQLNGQSTPALVFYISNVPFSASSNYSIQFPIATASGLLPGSYTNTAQFAYADSTNATPSGTNAATNPCNTGVANTGNCLTTNASYTLNQLYSATLSTTSTNPVASASAGNTVYFTELLTNTGNGNDTIQLSTANNLGNAFPVGTTFTYYAADGVTGLTPTSGTNGTTGALFASPTLAPNGTFTYVIGVTLPGAYTTASSISFNAVATPKAGTGTAVTATDTVSKVISAVDLLSGFVNGSFGTPTSGAATVANAGGLGAGTATVIVAAPGVNPNSSYTYELWLENNQGATDSFNVVASNTSTFSTSDNLPAGMTVSYFNGTAGSCSVLGSAITMPIANVPTFSGSNAQLVCARVTVAAGFSAGTQNVYFQAASATTPSAKDFVQDTFTTNAYYHVTVSSTSGQVNPGASVVYTNTIVNDGNQPISTLSFASSFVTDTPGGSPAGGSFTSTLYQTASPLGSPVSTSTTFSNLAVGGTVTLYAQVNAAPQDVVGQNDSTTITVTYTTGSGTSTAFGTDTTNVVSAINNVVVTKTQSLDAGCTGTPGTWSPLTPTTAAVQAKPGDCVVYRISVDNNTGATVKNVSVSDQLNSYLTYCDGTAGTCGTAVAAGSWNNLGASTPTGSVSLVGNLVTSTALNQVTSGQSTPYFQFEVKIK